MSPHCSPVSDSYPRINPSFDGFAENDGFAEQ